MSNVTTNNIGENYCQQKNRQFEERIQQIKNAAKESRANGSKFIVSQTSYLSTCEYFEKEIAKLQSLLKPKIQRSVYRTAGFICAGNGIIGEGDSPEEAFKDYTRRLARENENAHS